MHLAGAGFYRLSHGWTAGFLFLYRVSLDKTRGQPTLSRPTQVFYEDAQCPVGRTRWCWIFKRGRKQTRPRAVFLLRMRRLFPLTGFRRIGFGELPIEAGEV